ncbi:MAG: DNA polymerase III subunit delta [Bacteroidales bacterium]|nr:DNA polymerase III subunit delta [Bacteroidales bacterium]
MKFEQILKDLQQKKYKPIYLLMGTEPYYIDKIADFIEDNVISEAEKSFNLSIMYGKDTEARNVDLAAKRYPMMSPYQVIIVKEAQDIKKINDLVHYAGNPLETTILVLAHKYKTIAKTTKLYKAIDKVGVILESKKLYDNKVPDWISNYVAEKKLRISPMASGLLSEYLGNDLSKVANEINKLALSLPENTEINPKIIQENIGISKEYNVFELQDALTNKDIMKTNRIIMYFGAHDKKHPIFTTINFLYTFFSKLLIFHFTKDKSDANLAKAIGISPYFLKNYRKAASQYPPKKTVQIISYLRDYDLRAKGVNNVSAQAGDLLIELVFKILH